MLQVRTELGEDLQHSHRQARGEAEDEDLALARILQEQEQLFMRHLRRSHTDTVRSSDSPTAVSASSTGSPAASARLQQNHDAASSRALSGLGMTSAAEQAPGADEDMEFALRLQEEEDRMHYQHMLQLAGVGRQEPDEEQYLSDDSVDPDEMTYEQLQALGETVGVVSRGASHDVMDMLHKTTYAEHNPDHAQEGCAEQCTVCRMEFEGVDDVCLLGCKHCYHTDCIAQWLKHSKKCPICHTEVAADSSKTTVSIPASAVLLTSKKTAATGP